MVSATSINDVIAELNGADFDVRYDEQHKRYVRGYQAIEAAPTVSPLH